MTKKSAKEVVKYGIRLIVCFIIADFGYKLRALGARLSAIEIANNEVHQLSDPYNVMLDTEIFKLFPAAGAGLIAIAILLVCGVIWSILCKYVFKED